MTDDHPEESKHTNTVEERVCLMTVPLSYGEDSTKGSQCGELSQKQRRLTWLITLTSQHQDIHRFTIHHLIVAVHWCIQLLLTTHFRHHKDVHNSAHQHQQPQQTEHYDGSDGSTGQTLLSVRWIVRADQILGGDVTGPEQGVNQRHDRRVIAWRWHTHPQHEGRCQTTVRWWY